MRDEKTLINEVVDISGLESSDYQPYADSIIIYGFDLAKEDYRRFEDREFDKYSKLDHDEIVRIWTNDYDMRKLNSITIDMVIRRLPKATQLFLEYREKTDEEIFKELYNILSLSYQVWIDEKLGSL